MSKEEPVEPEKEAMINVKDMSESDWRGVLALTIIVGSFILICIGLLIDRLEILTGGVWTLMYAVTNWYFKAKEKKEIV
jgi:hypothetical protein